MPTAPVNDRGDVLAYEDSGPPSDHTDYTTIVIVHGLVFYTPVFHRLLPHARECNFRIVLLNMRDYPGSSSFCPEELEAFSTSPHNAVQEIGHQLAAFLVYFVQKYKIPEIRLIDGKQTAGLVFLTWSFSNTFHMSLLGNAHTLPAETKAVLSKYWRRSAMYDPALGNIGATIPPGAYSPLRDASLTPIALTKRFATWVSAYYPPVPASAMSTYTVEDLIARQQLADDPSFKESLPIEYMKTSTVERMTSEELERMTDPGVVERSAQAMRAVPRDIYKDNARRALWEPEVDPDSGSGEVTFPNLSVLVLWFDMTMGDCIWAVKTLHDAHAAEQQKEGSRAREVEFVCLKWLNHFAHWDDPEGIMRNLAEHL